MRTRLHHVHVTVVTRPARQPLSGTDPSGAVALLNCVVRELAGPRGGVRELEGRLGIDLPAAGARLRAGLRRPVHGVPALTGAVERWGDDGWAPIGLDELIRLTAAELTAVTGVANPSLPGEIAGSAAFVAAVQERLHAQGPDDRTDYQAGEQSLVAGHRFHPAPKARSGPLAEALAYAPEAGARFRLRYLAVPENLLWQRELRPGAADVFDAVDGASTEGERLLPVHPWQYRILTRTGRLHPATGLRDLGELGPEVVPTSSVRTVDAGDRFLKLSLSVRLTNCLRVNPRHEAEAAVTLSRLLEPLRTELALLFPGTVVLRETAARTVTLDGDLPDALGVIVREGVPGRMAPGVEPVLAAALVEPRPAPTVERLLARVTADRDALVAWWDAYLDRVVPPVLHAYLAHGVVLEAHLQNVLIGVESGVDADRAPRQVVLRDLEGVKLTGPRHEATLRRLPGPVRDHVRYSAVRGWQRVAYCLLVNNVSGVLGALADRDPGTEPLLWNRVRHCLKGFRRDVGDAPQLRTLLAGGPVPAKTNLLTRWRADHDRDSGYVPLSLPLG